MFVVAFCGFRRDLDRIVPLNELDVFKPDVFADPARASATFVLATALSRRAVHKTVMARTHKSAFAASRVADHRHGRMR
jgi:hypothetical protein